MNKGSRRLKKNLSVTSAILVGLFLSLHAGTGQGGAIPSASTSHPGSVVKTAPTTLPMNYTYRPFGKADPFQPFVEKEISRKKVSVMKKAKPPSIFPLQRAAIGEFKLIGIAGNEQERTAMVATAGGKFFPLSVGTVIGLKGGQVTEILEDRVIVEETAAVGKGQYKTRRIPLKLQKVE